MNNEQCYGGCNGDMDDTMPLKRDYEGESYRAGFQEGYVEGAEHGYRTGHQLCRTLLLKDSDKVEHLCPDNEWIDEHYSRGMNDGYPKGFEFGFQQGFSRALKGQLPNMADTLSDVAHKHLLEGYENAKKILPTQRKNYTQF